MLFVSSISNNLSRLTSYYIKMTFCEKCDALLVPKKIEGKVLAVCQDCGWIEESNQLETISFTDQTRNEDPEGGKMLIIDDSDTSVTSRPRKEMICPRCDTMQIVEYWEIQTRSADESPTRFFRCTNCDKNWREYD